MKTLIAVALSILASVPTFAQGTLIYRADVQNNAKRRDTIAVINGLWQVWAHGVNTTNPSYELGRSWTISKGALGNLSFISYGVYQPAHGGLYVEPMVVGSLKLPCQITLDGNMAAYIPLGEDGKLAFFTNRVALTCPIGKFRVGLAVTFFDEEGKTCRFRTGLLIKWDRYEARLLPSHSGAPPSVRLQANLPVLF